MIIMISIADLDDLGEGEDGEADEDDDDDGRHVVHQCAETVSVADDVLAPAGKK
jgi:hypothetical protein